jgi:hypothetical protein
MINRPTDQIVQTLAFKGVEDAALRPFESLLQVGYTAAADAGLPVQSYFNDRINEIIERNGLVDAWLIAICLTTFAQGIAVGRGTTTIDQTAVQLAHDNLCDIFPDCQVRRLQDYVQALSIMLEQQG